MITIDFSLAVALFIFLFVNLAIVFWLVNKKEKSKELSLDKRFIWYCSICTYTYINTREDLISTCPRCGSYNKKIIDKI